jgi:hypothetical protein
MSEETKSRRAYIASHNFSVHVNPLTKEEGTVSDLIVPFLIKNIIRSKNSILRHIFRFSLCYFNPANS